MDHRWHPSDEVPPFNPPDPRGRTEPHAGIEPALSPWQGGVRPLHQYGKDVRIGSVRTGSQPAPRLLVCPLTHFSRDASRPEQPHYGSTARWPTLSPRLYRLQSGNKPDCFVRLPGVEPGLAGWKPAVLPKHFNHVIPEGFEPSSRD